jgi:hypothetical protein
MPYSVSPRRVFAMKGGKKSANRSTRIPVFFATTKWPNSWRMTKVANPTAART